MKRILPWALALACFLTVGMLISEARAAATPDVEAVTYHCREMAEQVRIVATLRDQKVPREALEASVKRAESAGQLQPEVAKTLLGVIGVVYANPNKSPYELAHSFFNFCFKKLTTTRT